MSNESTPHPLKHELRRLLRSLDFVARHPALKKDGREARRFAEIYQQLGRYWEFLALQCGHRDGWRKGAEGRLVCKTCGTVKGAGETWLLLPRKGRKVIGHRARPTTEQTLPNRKAATVVNDTIDFHGTRLNVEVLNPHRSRLFRNMNITVAADRLVRLEESDVECRLDDHLAGLQFKTRKPKTGLPYSAFVWELPRKALKRFPVMLEYDRRGRFVGVTIFRPRAPRHPSAAGG